MPRNYGIPYQGSKTRVIDRISELFPDADNFYDLFGGGFSVTHYMLLHCAKSYKQFHFNEIRPGICELVQDAINGKYNYDRFKPEFVTREMFFERKDKCAYTKMIWSFGNNGKNYLFGKDIEPYKKALHQAVIFDEFNEIAKERLQIDRWPDNMTVIKDRRLLIRKIIKERYGELEQLERLQQLQQTTLDYREVLIKPNSVVYCDIPYKGTIGYGSEFNHDEFFNWAHQQANPVFISEYNVDDSRFKILKELKHNSSFSPKKNKAVIEKVYGNEAALDHFASSSVRPEVQRCLDVY